MDDLMAVDWVRWRDHLKADYWGPYLVGMMAAMRASKKAANWAAKTVVMTVVTTAQKLVANSADY